MRFSRRLILAAAAAAIMHTVSIASAAAEGRAVGIDDDTGLAAAVVVEDTALAHTTQLLPVDAAGKLAGDTLDAQLEQVVANIGTALDEVGSSLEQLARLNVYVTSDELAGEVRARLKNHLGPDSHPAATFVVTPLGVPGAMVALDGIAAVRGDRAPDTVLRHTSPNLNGRPGAGHVAVLPRGRTLYISGMAERNDDLAVATVGTMKQLHQVLGQNKIGPAQVVHLKAFMKPMDDVDTVEKLMGAFYPAKPSPAMTFVAWRNGLPIEIELIAHLPEADSDAEPVSLRWQPDEKRSPVYCRFAVVNSPTRIYTQGILPEEAADANAQIHSIYDQLKAIVEPLGSDFRHLVKATYYHSAADTGKALNDIRPELYDPERPPAASKANIAGTGDPERTMVIDMIAVPK